MLYLGGVINSSRQGGLGGDRHVAVAIGARQIGQQLHVHGQQAKARRVVAHAFLDQGGERSSRMGGIKGARVELISLSRIAGQGCVHPHIISGTRLD